MVRSGSCSGSSPCGWQMRGDRPRRQRPSSFRSGHAESSTWRVVRRKGGTQVSNGNSALAADEDCLVVKSTCRTSRSHSRVGRLVLTSNLFYTSVKHLQVFPHRGVVLSLGGMRGWWLPLLYNRLLTVEIQKASCPRQQIRGCAHHECSFPGVRPRVTACITVRIFALAFKKASEGLVNRS